MVAGLSRARVLVSSERRQVVQLQLKAMLRKRVQLEVQLAVLADDLPHACLRPEMLASR